MDSCYLGLHIGMQNFYWRMNWELSVKQTRSRSFVYAPDSMPLYCFTCIKLDPHIYSVLRKFRNFVKSQDNTTLNFSINHHIVEAILWGNASMYRNIW